MSKKEAEQQAANIRAQQKNFVPAPDARTLYKLYYFRMDSIRGIGIFKYREGYPIDYNDFNFVDDNAYTDEREAEKQRIILLVKHRMPLTQAELNWVVFKLQHEER